MPLPNILQIAYYFPPIQSVGTIRNHKVYCSFKKENTNVFILTTSNRKIFHAEYLKVDEKDIYEIYSPDCRKLLWHFGWRHVFLPHSLKKDKVRKFVLNLLKSLPFSLIFSDGGPIYLLFAFLKGCQLIKKEKIQVLYSSYSPVSDHLIAWSLKVCFPKAIWIADFRDLPFKKDYRMKFPGQIHNRCLRRIIKKVDLITTVSEGLQKEFKYAQKPVWVIRNAAHIRDFHNDTHPFKKFTIAYTGSLYPGLQDASPILNAIKQLTDQKILTIDNFQLIYAGKDRTIWEHWIKKAGLIIFNRSYPYLSQKKATIIQKRAHINLLLVWHNDLHQGILTTKLFNYLTTGKPIIAISKGTIDPELDQIISFCKHSMLIPADSQAVGKLREKISFIHSLSQTANHSHLSTMRASIHHLCWENQFKRLLLWLAFNSKQPISPENSGCQRKPYP